MELISQLRTILKPDFLQGQETDDLLILEEPQDTQEDTRIELIGVSVAFSGYTHETSSTTCQLCSKAIGNKSVTTF